MEAKLVERQRQASQLSQLERQAKALRSAFDQINEKCSRLAHPHSLAVPSELKQKAVEAKVRSRLFFFIQSLLINTFHYIGPA